MAGNTGLSAHQNMVLERGAARNARLSDQHAASSQGHVVPDLHEIINLRPGTDDGIRPGAAVDGAVGADLDVVLDDHPAELGHGQVSLRIQGEAEAPVADAHPRVDDATLADQTMAQKPVGPDLGFVADHHAALNDGVGVDEAVAADFHVRADDDAGTDRSPLADPSRRIDQRRRVPPGGEPGFGIEGPRHQRVGPVRLGRKQQGHAFGRPLGMVRRNHAGARPTGGKLVQIVFVVEKADVRRAGPVERGDIGENSFRIRSLAEPDAGKLGDFAQLERARNLEKAGISHNRY